MFLTFTLINSFKKHFNVPGAILSALLKLPHLIFMTTLGAMYYFNSHLLDEKAGDGAVKQPSIERNSSKW